MLLEAMLYGEPADDATEVDSFTFTFTFSEEETDADTVVPFARVINNTVYGSETPTGTEDDGADNETFFFVAEASDPTNGEPEGDDDDPDEDPDDIFWPDGPTAGGDILVGGSGNDTILILPADGEDILIGGTTSYDADKETDLVEVAIQFDRGDGDGLF